MRLQVLSSCQYISLIYDIIYSYYIVSYLLLFFLFYNATNTTTCIALPAEGWWHRRLRGGRGDSTVPTLVLTGGLAALAGSLAGSGLATLTAGEILARLALLTGLPVSHLVFILITQIFILIHPGT
jgi:hypothetical protein